MRSNDYISTLSLVPPLDADGVRRLARHSCLDIHRVEWLRSYLATDGTRMVCWYRAADAESVRLALRHQGATGTTVSPAGVAAVRPTDVSAAAPSEAHDTRVVVEMHAASHAPKDAAALRATVVAALTNAGYALSVTFTATSGAPLVVLVDGADPAVVNGCLQSTGLAPSAVWACVELDPRPTGLFKGSAPHAPAGGDRRAPAVGEARLSGGPKAAAAPAPADADLDAVIIGTGLSGICTLHRLLAMGLRVRAYDGASDVGGVWHWNRYPGARVDSETYTYGFSFSDELVRDWEWQELFSPQPEITRYLTHTVERFDLRRHMRLATRIAAARFDERHGRWQIETDGGERTSARYLVAATGTLTTPQMPDFAGIDEFAGRSQHTARWPSEGVELAGKCVGVVGTGASGVQVIQTIAPQVAALTVFQRTPTYCVPQRNRPLTDDDRRRIRRDWPAILAACRESYGGFVHTFDPRSGLAVAADEREAKFEELWQTPGFAFWFGNFADLMMNSEVNAYASDFVRRKIMARVTDPEIARKLLPDHPFGTKRVPLENGYYEVYNRPDVRLVDLRDTPIERITRRGIRTTDAEHALDVIIYATGFDAGTGALTRIDIEGEGGLRLADKWREGPRTFLGLLVGGFPNLFIVNGPHNAAALCNAGRCIEQNVDWIARCIERMRERGVTRIVPTASAEEEWTEHVYDVAAGCLLGKMTNSWFFGANTPGKPRRATIYAAGARAHREHCENVARAGYLGLTMS